MNWQQHILFYILAAITLSTSIIYFVLASNEYSHLIEFVAEGLEGKIPELQIEIGLFAGSGIIYLGLLGWVLVKKLKSITLLVIGNYFYNINNYLYCISHYRSSYHRC